jgi:two-component system, OmpR family, response regulator RegX3
VSRILLVEDEPAIAEAVTYALRGAGYDVDHADNGTEALAAARDEHYDLMVLDLLLPGTPGIEVCKTIRAESDLPIVMLTARDTEGDRVTGLDAGADDYLTKPFSVLELVSRVRALLRRRDLDRAGKDIVRIGSLHLDIARHSATLEGKPLRLTVSEFRLLQLLASGPGQTFTRESLIKHLWESDFVGDRRAIDVHISNLRRKLETDPRNPRRLLTVRGVGYKLVAG